MILITTRAQEVAEWIEANCSEPSRYTIGKAWQHDACGEAPDEMELKLSETDAMLFALYFAGWFFYRPCRGRWYDDTEINRILDDLKLWLTQHHSL